MMRWFDSLQSRTMVTLVLAVGIAHLASLWVHQFAMDQELTQASDLALAERLVVAKRAVARAIESDRERIAHDLSGGPLDMHWGRSYLAVPGSDQDLEIRNLESRIVAFAPELAEGGLVFGSGIDPHSMVLSMRLPDWTWLNVGIFTTALKPSSQSGTLLSSTLMVLGTVLVSLLLVRKITRPLSILASAAGKLYAGGDGKPVPEVGPRELRELSRAFNDMQKRIKKLVDTRTLALAAVSHDLKTPITRLRLRLEDRGSGETERAMAADLQEMDQMIDQTLAFIRGNASIEPFKRLDLTALIESIVSEAADLGGAVSLTAPPLAVTWGRPLQLKRAFANLVSNALRYGKVARVTLEESAHKIVVLIDDDGPGIPDGLTEKVFLPFFRIEDSRNLATGGFGLGLTIAHDAIVEHGGSIRLINRLDGGLQARIELPVKPRE